MRPWEVSIRNPVFITMVMLALVVLGVMAYISMPLDFFPDVSLPTMAIVTIYPGAGPSEVETQVTKPIEDAMVTASGVDTVQARSSEGYSLVIVSFNLNKDSKQALQDVREKIANVRSDLPDDVLEPSVVAYDPSSSPILGISVASRNGASANENIRLAVTQDVLPRLQRIAGVADATVSGGREREIQVLLDAKALIARHVAPQQVIQTILAESLNIPGGAVEQAGENLLLRTPGNFNKVSDVADLQIATGQGAVRVGDIATVQDGWKKLDTYSRLNGQEAVVVSVRKQSGTNTVQVAERVKSELKNLEKERPDLDLLVVQDQSIFVRESFNDAMRELLIGAFMASLVVFIFFRNLRNTLVTIAGLPIILLGTFAFMWFRGMTLNIVSLMALSLSVGLIIDDAIVVRENVFRHMEMGQTPRDAAGQGTAEVAMPVVAMSLTIVSVFLPIAFVGGIMGRFLSSFGLVVSVAVLISLVEALTFAPMLSAYLFKQQKPKQTVDAAEGAGIAHASLGRVERWYLSMLHWTLRYRWLTLALGVSIFAGSLWGATHLKTIFMPSVDQGLVNVSMAMPPGAALSATDQKARELETRLQTWPDVKSVLTKVGGSGTPESASFVVSLKPGHPLDDFIATARRELTGVPGLALSGGSFTSMAAGSNSVMGRPIQITLQTIGDAAVLDQFSLDLAQRLKAVPGLVDVDVSYQPGKPEVQIMVDRRKAADMGINIGTVGSTLRTLVEGSKVATFRGEGPEADLRVQLQANDRQKLEQILDLQVPTQRGFVALRQIARLENASGPTQLNRMDRQNSVIIGGNTFGRAQADVVKDVTAVMQSTTLPPGVIWKYSGEQKMQNESFSAMGMAMLLSVVFVYMVLASQFGSFIQPLVIMLALPLAAIGGLLSLVGFDKALDMTAMIGLILLMGLVTKNSILLVDLTNRLRRRHGMARDAALLTAGPIRLRPIIMTTLALILGMLPVAIGLGTGSSFRQPMALAVIGGLITSTILTLLLVPAAYSLVEGGLGRMQRARAARVAAKEAREAAKQAKESAAA